MKKMGKGVYEKNHSGWHRPEQITKKHRRLNPFAIVVLIILFFFAGIYALIFTQTSEQLVKKPPLLDQTKIKLENIIAKYPSYDIGVSLVDAKSGKSTNAGKQEQFTAASTTKLITASAIVNKIEKGELSLNRYIEGNPVSWHLEQLINQSNNDSWLALNNYLGSQEIIEYAKNLGLNSYKKEGNKISPKDMASLLYKLYKGQIMNEEHTKMILAYMQNTNEESFIPAIADTQNIEVFHKYGWYESNIHDVAILKTKNNAWALAIYTNPKNNEMDITTSTEIIHKITNTVIEKIDEKPNEN